MTHTKLKKKCYFGVSNSHGHAGIAVTHRRARSRGSCPVETLSTELIVRLVPRLISERRQLASPSPPPIEILTTPSGPPDRSTSSPLLQCRLSSSVRNRREPGRDDSDALRNRSSPTRVPPNSGRAKSPTAPATAEISGPFSL